MVTLLALIFVVIIYAKFQQFVSQPIGQDSQTKQSQVIEIKPGSSLHKVANQLQQQGLISDARMLVWYMRYLNKSHVVKAGEFEINPQWTVDELIRELENPTIKHYPVTLIAGQTIAQNLAAIAELEKIKRELDFSDIESLQALFSVDKKVDTKYPYANIEGMLLPETYYYLSGDSDKTIILRAKKAAQDYLANAWQNRAKNLPYKTPYEALIMASIVEKETGYAPERALIAGVFVNRLKRGMRLQTDPTVIYGIGANYDGNIRKRDLRTKTPYNTYTITGLPPTPIALPSKEAIDAVMHPQATKALYFVAKGEGKHHFSNTLVEHNRAVNKYLLNK
ncbi:endolytic transglycosylase MltG [Thiomicrorhabdus sediminis]|uniref:Endolytic murein transglycosylase n=1 Tax=Thiomicrorhabdus sediminis TaxID=2580412 RepID=A0A4P9K818_9GAMM|nr:endolytic transglycosylase MltG [Thiomicrorhabdus sediminis]